MTVYDNKDEGGFAGAKPVTAPENFRCAFNKKPGPAEDIGESQGNGDSAADQGSWSGGGGNGTTTTGSGSAWRK